MKIGAKMAHLGMSPGMMMSSSRMTTIIPISSGSAPMPGRLEQLRERDREHAGQVAVVEVGDELADHQQHEDEPGEAGERLRDRRDDVVGAA